jgi:5'-3' exonuclease
MILLIDADLVAYRCSASVEPHGDEDVARLRCDRLMQELLHTTGSEQYISFLTGPNNFRKKVNPEYKANRKDTIPPQWLQSCRRFLVEEWNSAVSDGCEADDLLGINQTTDTMIASLDKDLLMIPGQHYNWVKQEQQFVDEIDGIKHLYKQMLIGDRADNIFGVDGIGKVKAAKHIDHLETEDEMIETVFDLYGEDALRFYMNAQCLWIMRNEGETWADRLNHLTLPALLQQEVDQKSSSTKYLMGATSTEPTMSSQKMCGIPVVGEVTESTEINPVV